MKKSNIIWILVLLSMILVISGCGEKEPATEEDPSETVTVEGSEEDTTLDDESDDEPELPDDAVSDEGEDVTEVEAEDMVESEDDETVEESGVEEEVDSTAEADDEGTLSSENESEENFTAQNYRVISLKDLKAYPSDMTINVGTTVEWRNINDNIYHIIGWRNQRQMGVDPEPIKAGESWSFRFDEPGTISWFSTARPTVQGKIYVEE